MENKELSTVRKITGELIGGFILYGIVFSIIYRIIITIVIKNIPDSYILLAITSIVLQGFCAFFIWRFSISSTFKKRSISPDDIPTVIRNMFIFSIIICIISAIYNFSNVNKQIDDTINSNISLRTAERMMQYVSTQEEIDQYEAEKEKIINEAKHELYTYLAILEIGSLIVYLGVIPLQKSKISEYSV